MQPSQFIILALAGAASSVVAQTTTSAPVPTLSTSRRSQGTAQASIFIPVEAASALTAVTVPVSAIGAANPSATTYAIGCSDIARVPAIASVLCPSDVQTLTLTAGPSVVQGTLTVMTGGVKATAAISCNVQGTTSADCTSVVTAGGIFVSTRSAQYTTDLNFLPVSITAGVTDKAAPGASSTTTGSSNAAVAGYSGVSGMGVGIFGTVMGMLTTLFI